MNHKTLYILNNQSNHKNEPIAAEALRKDNSSGHWVGREERGWALNIYLQT